MAATRDKTPLIEAFVIPLLREHVARDPSTRAPPFFLGISGPQGSGKTTLVSTLAATLRAAPHGLNVVVLSIDDIYVTYEDQRRLRELYPENRLVSHRGEPGTHDVELGKKLFAALAQQQETKVPAYDKSAHGGQGDRADEQRWEAVKGPYDVVIFEGWCVGFRALEDGAVERKWRRSGELAQGTLKDHKLEDVLFVNAKLREYDVLTDSLDALVHIDAEDISYVYDWRIEQEHALIAARGSGMSDAEVKRFVDGYMPGYELYAEALRAGVFRETDKVKKKQQQQRITIARDRSVAKVEEL